MENIAELSGLSQKALKDLVGSENNSTQLWEFFHKEQKSETNKPTDKPAFRGGRHGGGRLGGGRLGKQTSKH